ncbi:hypothetical protein [Paenibacillus abyssi]|uniref:Phage tail tape measure protein n=1 Tax=Paenibacillus abyssi TaxID=1340531 RepID=A0A917CH36_9BACL|nr:hypothetical protein [Paenibacillus abyssi]GGF88518.1 hypothetical protein GCM10010916_02340 [Paenibacillus abyssi]
MKLGEILVKIGVDASDVKAGFNEGERAADRFSRSVQRSMKDAASSMKDFGAKMMLFVTTPLALVGRSFTQFAMAAEESEATFKQVMGSMESDARRWSEQLGKAFNVNDIAMRKNMTTLYSMTKSMGLPEKSAYNLSKGITQLTYDLASFRDLDFETAFYKLRSGLTGETEPLKEVGILVSDNIITEAAYRNGIAKTGAKLTEQQKVLARYAAIMEQTKEAQGQWIREMDNAASKAKQARDQYNKMAAIVGTKLLPIVTKMLTIINRLLLWFQKLPDGIQTSILVLGAFAALLGPVIFGLGALLTVLPAVTAGFATFFGVFKGAKMLQIAGGAVGFLGRAVGFLGRALAFTPWGRAISIIVSGLGLLYGSSEKARTAVERLIDRLLRLFGVQKELPGAAAVESVSTGYDDFTSGITEGMGDVEDATDSAGKAAKKFLAAFDEVYDIPDQDGGAGSLLDDLAGAMNGAAPGIGSGVTTLGGTDLFGGTELQVPGIVFEPPTPPDAGAGAVATAWNATMNELIASMPLKYREVWSNLLVEAETGALTQAGVLTGLRAGFETEMGTLGTNVNTGWTTFWENMGLTTMTGRTAQELETAGMRGAVEGSLTGLATNAGVIWSTMWASLFNTSLLYKPLEQTNWDGLRAGITETANGLATDNKLTWSTMWAGMLTTDAAMALMLQTAWIAMRTNLSTETNGLASYVLTKWNTMWSNVLTKTIETVPTLVSSFLTLGLGVSLAIQTAEQTVSLAWQSMLSSMQNNLNAYRPYLEYGISLIVASLSGLGSAVDGAKSAWSSAWQGIYDAVNAKTAPVLSLIESVRSAYATLMATLGQPISIPKIEMPKIEMPAALTSFLEGAGGLFGNPGNLMAQWGDLIASEASKPENQAALGALGVLVPAGKAGQAAATGGKAALEMIKSWVDDLLAGGLKGIPGFANGGIIGSDSIIRAGEGNKREAIIPLENTGAMRPFAEAVAHEMGGMGGGGLGGDRRPIYVHTLIADDRGLKELERRMRIIRINEDGRGE